MNGFTLDLDLEVLQGSVHGLGQVTLWIRLRADTRNPTSPRPELLICERHGAHWSPPELREAQVKNQDLLPLVEALRAFQHIAVPEIRPVATHMAGWQEIHLTARLDGQPIEFQTVLQYGGIEGGDAETLRHIWHLLTTLAEVHHPETWIKGTN